MKDLILVTSAKYLHDYTLELTFSDGVKAEIDFTDWIKKFPFFKPLRKYRIFQKLHARRLDSSLGKRRRHRARNSLQNRA